MWTCCKCGEKISDSFEVCWACGTTIDGVEDPEFLTRAENDMAPNPELQPLIGNPEMLVTVTRCVSQMEAYAIKVHLESEGVHVFLADEFTVTMDWLLSNAIGGIKVQVPEDEVPKALEVLGLAEKAPKYLDDAEPDTRIRRRRRDGGDGREPPDTRIQRR